VYFTFNRNLGVYDYAALRDGSCRCLCCAFFVRRFTAERLKVYSVGSNQCGDARGHTGLDDGFNSC
jgi:hypothetical protein